MKKVFLLAAAALSFTAAAEENILINGDFEEAAGKSPIPGWYFNARRQPHPQIDTVNKKSGKQSMVLGNTTTINVIKQSIGKKDMSIFLNGFTISGWMKYENIVKGGKIKSQLPFLKLEFSLGRKRLRYPGVVVLRANTGSKDWFKFEVSYSAADAANMFKDIPASRWPTSCALSLYSNRQPGKVWLDDVKFVFHKKKQLDITLNSSEISSSQLDFRFSADAEKVVEFKIVDAAGKTVGNASSKGTGKAQIFSINVETLPAGEYTLCGRIAGEKTDSVTLKFKRLDDAFAQ